MTEPTADAQQTGPSWSETRFSDVKREIAERNERAHKEARDFERRASESASGSSRATG